MKVLVTDKINETAGKIIEEVAEVDFLPTMSEEELINIIPNYDALMVRSQTKVTARIIEAGKNLKIIGRAGVGVDNIDLESATQNGVIVVNSPDGNTMAAAEHTIALMLAMARKVAPAATSTKEGKWERSKFTGCELYKKVLGVIGFGKIGSHVAEVALALGKNIYDPEIPVNIYDLGLIYNVDFDPSGEVTIQMTLTAPNCPMADILVEDVNVQVAKVKGVEKVNVILVFEPAWDKSMMSEEALLELNLL